MTPAETPDAADALLAKIAAALPGWQVSLTEESDGWVARAVYNRFKGQTGRAQPSRLVAVERLLSRLWFPACLLADERERITALFDAHFGEAA